MKKLLSALSLVFVLLMTVVCSETVFAQDLKVTCSGNTGCSSDAPAALFPSTEIWYPGKSLSKTITIVNDTDANPLAVSTKAQNFISDNSLCQMDEKQLILSIVKVNSAAPNSLIWSGSLYQFYHWPTNIGLTNLPTGSSSDFIYTVSMRQEAGNECQNKETNFDLVLGFEGDVPSATAATSTGPSDSKCTDKPPGSVPVFTGAVAGVNSVTLTWTEANDPVSYYLVAYGTSSGVYSFGNPNVGGKGTTSYTVHNLSGGTIYYFVVRAGNGCAPGSFSNELAATPTGGYIYGAATGFMPNILGEATNSAKTTVSKTGKESTKGISTKLVCADCVWLPFIVGEILILLFLYFKVFKKNLTKKQLILSFLIPLLIYFLFIFSNKKCSVNSLNIFCRYFLFVDLTGFVFTTLLWQKYTILFKQKKRRK